MSTIYLADLQNCQPAVALADTLKPGRWRRLPYTTDQFGGTMLIAGQEGVAPEVTYPLHVRGWHRISIGLYGERFNGNTVLEVRLSDEPGFSVLTLREGPLRSVFALYWKEADLTGRQLVFRQLADIVAGDGHDQIRRGRMAMVAYIKLEPLTDAEVRRVQADRRAAENKRLFTHNDAHGFIWFFGAAGAAEVYREIEPYRDTDFSRMYWEVGMGDLLHYPGKAGRLLTCDGVDGFLYSQARVHAEAWRTMRERGEDILRHAAEMSHQAGLEFHVCYRLGGFNWPPPEDHWNGPGFYAAHPELRSIARDGRPAGRLSYAFPETRQFAIALLREVVENYPADGVCLLYVRRPPFVDYEPPLVAGFRAEYGLDPRALLENDPRWLKYRGRIMTQFMREVRAAMDEVVAKRGRGPRLGITAIVSGRREENLRNALCVEDWVAEGLVDTLIPYTMAPDLDSGAEAWPDPGAARYWVELTQKTACRLSLSVLPRWMSPEAFRRTAAGLYGAGAESLFFWDCAYRVNYYDQHMWNAMRRLGHREELQAWLAGGAPNLELPQTPVRQIGDWNLTDDTPG